MQNLNERRDPVELKAILLAVCHELLTLMDGPQHRPIWVEVSNRLSLRLNYTSDASHPSVPPVSAGGLTARGGTPAIDSPASLLALVCAVLFSPMERQIILAIADGVLQRKEVRARVGLDSDAKLRTILPNLVDRGVLVKVTEGYKLADARILELVRAGSQAR